jgi:hypothetical protein
MDKKNVIKPLSPEELKGFEEFIEGHRKNDNFLPRPSVSGTKKETSFEHFTFLSTDAMRLARLNNLLNVKLPFAAKYDQGNVLIKEQLETINQLQNSLFNICDQPDSAYRKSAAEIFDSFFQPHQPAP